MEPQKTHEPYCIDHRLRFPFKLTHMPALPQAQRSMKSDFDSDPDSDPDFDSDFDIQTSKHRDQNRIFIQRSRYSLGWAWVVVLGFSLLTCPALAGERIAHMLPDANGCILFLGLDQDLYRLCPNDLRPQPQGQLPARPFGADLDPAGQLIAATDQGFFSPAANEKWEHITGAPKGGAWVRCFPDLGCLTWVWGKGLHRIGTEGLEAMEQAGLPDSPIVDICRTSDGSLWAALFGPGVFRLWPGERTWESVNTGLSSRHVLALSRDSRDRLYAGTFGGGLWVLPLRGQSWQSLPTLPARDITAVATSPDDDRLILVGTRRQGLWLSTDQGRSWAGDSEIAGTVSSLLWRTTDEAWAAEESGVLYRMQDNKWQEVDFGPGFVPRTAVIIQDGTVFLIQGRTMFRLDSPGNGWETVRLPIQLDREHIVLAADPQDTIYLGGPGKGVFKSSDRGHTWQPLVQGMPERTNGDPPGVNDLLALGPDQIYAAPQGGAVEFDYQARLETDSEYLLHQFQGRSWTALEMQRESKKRNFFGLFNALDFLPGHGVVARGVIKTAFGRPGDDVWRAFSWPAGRNIRPMLDAEGNMWVEAIEDGRELHLMRPVNAKVWMSNEASPEVLYADFVSLGDKQWAALSTAGKIARFETVSDGLRLRKEFDPPEPLHQLEASRSGHMVGLSAAQVFYSPNGGRSWHPITPR